MADSNLDRKEIEELRRLINLLEKDIKGVDFDNLIKSGPAARALLQSLRKESEEFTSDISDAAIAFKNVVGEIRKTNIGLNEAGKSFNKLSSIADKVQYHQKEISSLSSKEVEKLKQQAEQEKIKLDNALDLLKIQENTTKSRLESINRELEYLNSKPDWDEKDLKRILKLESLQKKISDDLILNRNTQEEISGTLEGQNHSYNTLVSTLDRVGKEAKRIEKTLGLTGVALKGISKIPILGELIDTTEALEAAEKAAKGGAGRIGTMSAAMGSMGKSLLSSFADPLPWLGLIVKAIQFIIDLMFEADKQVTDIAKSFNITKDSAREVRDRFFEMSDKAENFATIQKGNIVLQKDLVAANIKINELLGVSVDLSSSLGVQGEKLVTQFANASKFLKLSDEEAKGLLSTTLTTGREVDDIKFSILGSTRLYKAQNGVLVDERKVLQSVLTASNAIKLSIKGGVEGLTRASIEATKLGLDLNKVAATSEKLLDFEQSITSELEAELLTGKDLNLETARLAALNGDLETFAKEINKQIGSSADFTKMNVLQQEALAKSVGMTREDLADTLITQESLNKLKGKFNVLGKETIENLKKSGKIDEATYKNLISGKAASVDYYNALKQSGMAQKDIVTLLGQEAAASLEAQYAQDKFNDTLEKAKETFTRFVDGGYLDKLADSLAAFVKSIGNRGLVSTLTGGMEEEMGKMRLEKAGYKVEEGEGLFGTGAFKKTVITKNGKEIDWGIGSQGVQTFANEILGPEEKEPKTKMATGGIVTKPTRALVGEAGPEAVLPLTQLMNEFAEMKKYLAQIASKEGKIYMGPTQVGTAVTVGTYKIS